MLNGQLLDFLAGVIGRHAIHNQDFDFTGVILGQDGAQAALDVGGFVTDGEDDGDNRGCHIGFHVSRDYPTKFEMSSNSALRRRSKGNSVKMRFRQPKRNSAGDWSAAEIASARSCGAGEAG